VRYPQNKLVDFLKEYEECINDLYSSLPLPIYNKIVATGIKNKLKKIERICNKITDFLAYFHQLLYIITMD